MTRRERENHHHAHESESMIVIHDGVCGNPESYACTQSRTVARILMRFPERFGLLDVCECGCPMWGAIVRRDRVPTIVAAIDAELAYSASVEEAETDVQWHEETCDHLAHQTMSRN